MQFLKYFEAGENLRSIGKNNQIVDNVKTQNDVDEIFECLFHPNRVVKMRAIDVLEKATVKKAHLLNKHKKELIELSSMANDKEFKWHLAQLLPRLKLSNNELGYVWDVLTKWAKDKNNSRIVRVFSIQGLYDLSECENDLLQDFFHTLLELEKEQIPSISARIRNIKKDISKKEKSK